MADSRWLIFSFLGSIKKPAPPSVRPVQIGMAIFHAQTDPRVPHRRWPRWLAVTALLLVFLLVVARLTLPHLLKTAINQRLESIPSYTGHVNEVGVSLIRGAYTMNGVELKKRDVDGTRPFLAVEAIDFSLVWRELLRGRIVSEIHATRPRLNFVQGATRETSQLDFDRRWQDVINDLFPIEITHFEVTEGELHFVAPERDPPVDIFVRDLKVVVRGLRNRPDLNRGDAVATILVEGVTPGNGQLALSSELEPLAPRPRFHLKLKIDKLSLPAVNQFLLAYGNVDVSAGEFTGYLEMVARDDHYQGYFKPFFENLQFKSASDADKSIFVRVWEKMVAALAQVVKNRDTEQVALRIPFEGDFGATRVETWESIKALFRNGFIQALAEGLDGHPRPKGNEEKPATPSDPEAEKKVPEAGK
jgi:hypothetical protein